jgi:pilus assembly protein Flp/PilA
MSKTVHAIHAFIADEGGVTALEYGMIAALIAAVIAAAITTIGTKLDAVFKLVKDALPAT